MKTLTRGEVEQVVAKCRATQGFSAGEGDSEIVDKLLAAQADIAAKFQESGASSIGAIVAMVAVWLKQLLPIFISDPAILGVVNTILDLIVKWFPAPTA